MIRIAGCLLVLSACGLFGVKLHFQLVEGYRECCLFQGLLLEIRRNNRQAGAVMADLLQEILKSMPEGTAVEAATRECMERLRMRTLPMEWIWEQYIGRIQQQLHLPVTLLIQTKRLGRVLSHRDSETIERYLNGVLELLETEMQERADNLKTRDVVRSSLCAMTGILTVLLLI